MKPNLLIGLGNPLMGDEGIGWHVVERLAGDPRLPQDTELLQAGTDLLPYAGHMEGRERVILVDALLDSSEPGTTSVFENDFLGVDDRQPHVHHLSLVQSLRLLRIAAPSLAAVRFTLLAIAIDSATLSLDLSPALSARVPRIVDRLLELLTA